MGERPVYKHDCDACNFLGTLTYKHTITGPTESHTSEHVADLYWCTKSALGVTIIARMSDDGPDYSSTPVCILETIKERMDKSNMIEAKALLEGLRRFKERLDA